MMIGHNPNITNVQSAPSFQLVIAVNPDIEILTGFLMNQRREQVFDNASAL